MVRIQKNIFLFLNFFFLLISIEVFAEVAKVEIPCDQKNIILNPGEAYQFNPRAFDEKGQQLLNVQFQWKILDNDGYETTIPGTIDPSGLLKTSLYYFGPFKVMVTELSSGLWDQAAIDIRPASNYPNGQIARIEIFPSFIGIPAGNSRQFSIRCYDAYGQRIDSWRLQYWVTDVFGVVVQNVIWIDSPGILHTSAFAFRGPYTVRFEDTQGRAVAFMRVDIY